MSVGRGPCGAADDWPQFRGPDGNGVSTAPGLPLTWSETENVRRGRRRSTAAPGRRRSSSAAQVWLTTATPDGKDPRSPSPSIKRQRQDRPRPEAVRRRRRRSSPTRSTPTRRRRRSIEPRPRLRHLRIARHRGDRRDDRQGAVDAPRLRVQSLPRRRLVADRLPQPADHALRRQRHQYVVALDKNTGKTRLADDALDRFPGPRSRTASRRPTATSARRSRRRTSSRSAARRSHQPRIEGGLRLRSDDGQGALARRGAQRHIRAARGRSSAMASSSIPTGFATGAAARRPARRPRRRHRDARRVAARRGVPEQAVARCWPAICSSWSTTAASRRRRRSTGTVVWTSRIGGTFSASPLVSGDRVYFFSEDGKTTVIEAGPAFKVLAETSSATASWPRPRRRRRALPALAHAALSHRRMTTVLLARAPS